MFLLSAIERDHVLTAMETYDSVGGAALLATQGRGPDHVLEHRGRHYDAATIVGIAHGLANGRTLVAEEIPGGSTGAAKVLVRLGFEVRDDRPVRPATSTTRTTTRTSSRSAPRDTVAPRRTPGARAPAKTPTPRVAASDRPVEVCPSCFIALPATGVCDTCG